MGSTQRKLPRSTVSSSSSILIQLPRRYHFCRASTTLQTPTSRLGRLAIPRVCAGSTSVFRVIFGAHELLRSSVAAEGLVSRRYRGVAGTHYVIFDKKLRVGSSGWRRSHRIWPASALELHKKRQTVSPFGYDGMSQLPTFVALLVYKKRGPHAGYTAGCISSNWIKSGGRSKQLFRSISRL